MNIPSPHVIPDRRMRRAGVLLGFAMGGFFDGILLHQILQWHHLLSAVHTGALADLRFQVTVDGWFHALMYALAAAGLWTLYRLRSAPGASLRLIAPPFWMGFGGWHILDAVFSHWITGIHRIRMDSDIPLFWDVAWLAVFGLIPFFLGWSRRYTGGEPPTQRGPVSLALLAAALVAAGAANIFPLRGDNDTTVVTMRPDASAAGLLKALDGTDARIVWTDRAGGVWVVQGLSLPAGLALYRSGALYVSGTASPAGCAAWLRPAGGA